MATILLASAFSFDKEKKRQPEDYGGEPADQRLLYGLGSYARDPIGETSACSSLFSRVALNENMVAVEKCSLRVELPGKTIRKCLI